MSARLRGRAMSLMRQLDADGGYRELIERELKARISAPPARSARREASDDDGARWPLRLRPRACECGAANDADAAFCKRCGSKLAREPAHDGAADFRLKAEAASATARSLGAAAGRPPSSRCQPVTAAARRCPIPGRCPASPRPDPQLATGVVTVRVIRGSFDNPVVSLTVELAGLDARAARHDRRRGTGRVQGGCGRHAREGRRGGRGRTPRIAGVRDAVERAASGSRSWPPARPAGPRQRAAGGRGRPGTGRSRARSSSAKTRASSSRWGRTDSPSSTCCRFRTRRPAGCSRPTPLVFELPALARGATVLEGSSPQAKVSGRRLEIAGPFAPGNTLVQVAYTAPFGPAELVIEQPLPIELTHVAVVAQKVGDMQLQLAADARAADDAGQRQPLHRRPRRRGAGRNGAAVCVLRAAAPAQPGRATSRSDWPLLILAGGAWSAFRGRQRHRRARRAAPRARGAPGSTVRRARPRSRRATARSRPDPAHYAARRRELVAALERVYAALDDEIAVGRAS